MVDMLKWAVSLAFWTPVFHNVQELLPNYRSNCMMHVLHWVPHPVSEIVVCSGIGPNPEGPSTSLFWEQTFTL